MHFDQQKQKSQINAIAVFFMLAEKCCQMCASIDIYSKRYTFPFKEANEMRVEPLNLHQDS